jgi:hypothetical protein
LIPEGPNNLLLWETNPLAEPFLARDCTTNVPARPCSTKILVLNKKGMAGPTGFEPATSDVTGQRSNQLNYDPAYFGLVMVGGTGLEPVTPSL